MDVRDGVKADKGVLGAPLLVPGGAVPMGYGDRAGMLTTLWMNKV